MNESNTRTSRRSASPSARRWLRAVLGAMLPWLAVLIAIRPLVTPEWPPFAWSGPFSRWASAAFDDLGFFLPFLLFAGGSALLRVLGLSRRLARVVIGVGILSAIVSYAGSAVVAPVLAHRALTEAEIVEARSSIPRTPTALVRNLRFVHDNPPAEYSLSIDAPDRHPPQVLEWQLHRPASIAVFGVINLLLGILAAEATSMMSRPRQWNSRLAIGVAGAVAFYLLQEMGSPIQSFLRSDPMGSGVLAAWGPLALPLAEALLLGYLVWKRS